MLWQPSVVSDQTTASADDVLAVTLSPKTVTQGALGARMLQRFIDPATIAYSVSLGRMIGTTDENTAGIMRWIFQLDSGPGFKLSPRAGGYGYSRLYQLVANPSRNVYSDLPIIADVTNDFQRRTVAGLINRVDWLVWQANQHPATNYQKLDWLLDQKAGTIEFVKSAGEIGFNLSGFNITGQTISINLTSTKPDKPRKVFE